MPTSAPTIAQGQTEVQIDTFNQWMRGQPFYQTLLKSWGQDPGHPHNLSDSQKTQIVRAAQAVGAKVDESNMEVDDNGNFRNQGHKLRNTLIVAGIAGAALVTAGLAGAFAGAAAPAAAGVEAGATAGISSAVASGSLGLATLPALSTAAATTAISTASATIGATAANAAAAKIAASGGALTAQNIVQTGGGMSYSDILKYALPVAGNLVGGVIQANAAGNASDAQQKYLEEALAYEKEKDTYQRGIDAAAVARDETRYAGYQGRIAPFIANGTSSNDRMAALLGLPARSGSASGGGSASSGSSSGPAGVPVSPEITAANLANYKALGVSATGRGTGPTDSAYYDDQIAATGGLTAANKAYWFGPNGRIALDMQKAGVKAAPSPTSTTPAPASSAPVSAQPQARVAAQTVQMRAPDGSTQAVPADQVDHYTQRGATPLASTQTAPTTSTTMPGSAPLVTMRAPDGSTKSVSADQVAHYQQLGATLLGAAA